MQTDKTREPNRISLSYLRYSKKNFQNPLLIQSILVFEQGDFPKL